MSKIDETIIIKSGPYHHKVNCCVCKKPYKNGFQEFTYEMNSDFRGLCPDCYMKKLNENFSEEDARRFAEQAIEDAVAYNEPIGAGWHKDPYVSLENWNNKVEPMISKILEERRKAVEEKVKREKLKEATLLYKEAMSDLVSENINESSMIRIIAKILEKIEESEVRNREMVFRR